MDIKGIDIFSCLNNPFATKPKELVAKLATTEKNLECCLSINRRSKLYAVIDCLFFFNDVYLLWGVMRPWSRVWLEMSFNYLFTYLLTCLINK